MMVPIPPRPMAFFALSAPLFSTLSTPFKFKPSSVFLQSIPSSVRSMRSSVVAMAPDEEKMTRRSPLDFPIEWDRPKPGRRPDIFPQFSPMKTPLPPPMPADPPEEDEEDEEEKKEEEEENEEENPDKEDRLFLSDDDDWFLRVEDIGM